MTDTTVDSFLDGRLRIRQPKSGYRAGIDPVLLAAAAPAVPGDRVLDLGCGVGTALLCLGARVEGLSLVGVEIQPDLADLARDNLARNAINGEIVEADVNALPASLRRKSFQHVIANPPFFDRLKGSAASDLGRDLGRAGATPLADWLDVATRRLAPKGRLTVIQRAERLPELLQGFDSRVGDVVIRPISARVGRNAELVLVSARKGARGPARLSAPFVLHAGAHHDGDRDSYSTAARAILRGGMPLN